MEDITEREKKVLDLYNDFLVNKGRTPKLREVAEKALGYVTKQRASKVVAGLVRKGRIIKTTKIKL